MKPDRTQALWFFLLACLLAGSTARARAATDEAEQPAPPYLADILTDAGKSKERCYANKDSAGVQAFENGWLLTQFSPDREKDYLYAIIKGDKPHWFKVKSEYKDGMVVDCAGRVNSKNDHLLRWGFRWWYCSDKAAKVRAGLGEPEALETAAWVQYQRWSKGLLAAGLPAAAPDAEGRFHSLVNVFLKGAPKGSRGAARWNVVDDNSMAARGCRTECNAVWFYAVTGETGKRPNPVFEKGSASCAVRHPYEDFMKNRSVCNLCLEP